MIDHSKINWTSKESSIFINPRMPYFEKSRLLNIIHEYKLEGHIFLSTSGSTAIQSYDIKWVALSKNALINSARAVNEHLNCSVHDIILNTLPYFHVGGLSLFTRAYLCGAKIIDIYNENYKWNPGKFVELMKENKVSITSLVPTQVFDIVQAKLAAPATLKSVVVGGGFLNEDLFLQAKKLNWPILPSYGMTECCSQVATAQSGFEWSSGYPMLTILPHLAVNLTEDGRIEIQGNSLLTGYVMQSEQKVEFIDPKVQGKIATFDQGEFKNNKLIIYGRCDENIKINGENLSLIRLQSILEHAKQKIGLNCDGAIFAENNARKGNKLKLILEKKWPLNTNKINEILDVYNEQVFPFEKIQDIEFVENIPRTELGKLKRNLLGEILQRSH